MMAYKVKLYGTEVTRSCLHKNLCCYLNENTDKIWHLKFRYNQIMLKWFMVRNYIIEMNRYFSKHLFTIILTQVYPTIYQGVSSYLPLENLQEKETKQSIQSTSIEITVIRTNQTAKSIQMQ